MRGWWLLCVVTVLGCTGGRPESVVAGDAAATGPLAQATVAAQSPAATSAAAPKAAPAGPSAHRLVVDGRPLRVTRVETGTTVTNCCIGEQIRLFAVDEQHQSIEVTLSLLRMSVPQQARPKGPIDLANLPDGFNVTVSCRPYGSCRSGDHGSINASNSTLRGSLRWTTEARAPRLRASLQLSSQPRKTNSPAPVEMVVGPVVIHTACIHGMDQTCNADEFISSIRGKCLPDGTCQCPKGSSKVERSGKCL